MVHLDTNFLIAAMNHGSFAAAHVADWIKALEPITISVVAWSEFLAGPVGKNDEQHARELVSMPESLGAADAELAALLFNKTGRRSRSLADCMIAATAIRCSARLATNNSADFQPFVAHGLVLA